jgi:hypothetical protein
MHQGHTAISDSNYGIRSCGDASLRDLIRRGRVGADNIWTDTWDEGEDATSSDLGREPESCTEQPS